MYSMLECSVSTHLVVHQRSAIWMLGISPDAHGRRRPLMGIAWRVACLVCRTRRRLARRDLGICLLHRVWLARFLPGWPASSILRRTLSMCQEQDTNGDTDSRAELGESGRPYRYRSGSIMCSIIRHRQTSLVYCDSYEAVHRTMNSTTCWNMPLADTRKTCRHYTARPLLCWCIQSSLWRAGSRRTWG